MEDRTVEVLALVIAVQAEIEGMKADNLKAKEPVWVAEHFSEKARRLRELADYVMGYKLTNK